MPRFWPFCVTIITKNKFLGFLDYPPVTEYHARKMPYLGVSPSRLVHLSKGRAAKKPHTQRLHRFRRSDPLCMTLLPFYFFKSLYRGKWEVRIYKKAYRERGKRGSCDLEHAFCRLTCGDPVSQGSKKGSKTPIFGNPKCVCAGQRFAEQKTAVATASEAPSSRRTRSESGVALPPAVCQASSHASHRHRRSDEPIAVCRPRSGHRAVEQPEVGAGRHVRHPGSGPCRSHRQHPESTSVRGHRVSQQHRQSSPYRGSVPGLLIQTSGW